MAGQIGARSKCVQPLDHLAAGSHCSQAMILASVIVVSAQVSRWAQQVVVVHLLALWEVDRSRDPRQNSGGLLKVLQVVEMMAPF